MTAEFAVLGAGAMGSIIAAHLARAGHEVVVLARGRRADQVKSDGLQIRGLADFGTSIRVLTDPGRLRRADVLIVAMKALATSAALEPLRGAEIGAALSVQNGVMKNKLLGEAFGRERTLGALANISGELTPSGEVVFTRNVEVLVGSLAHAASGRAEEVAAALDGSGLPSRAVADIESQEWSKFTAWVALMAVGVVTRMNTWRFLTDPDAALILVRLVREMARLAEALNFKLNDESVLPVAALRHGPEQHAVAGLRELGERYRIQAPEHRLSTVQDLLAGRPLEVAETIGFAIQTAESLQLSLPLLDAAYRIVSAIDPARQALARPA